MTLFYTTPEEGSSDSILSEAQQTYVRTSVVLNKLVSQLGDGELGHSGETLKLLKELKTALLTANQERERLENERRKKAGIVHDYAVDFDAARSEIGRRLACLRAVGSARGVSE